MIFDFLLLPLLIFLARICDVTIGTIRIIFISRGNKFFAPLLGFFEVLIWIIAISRIMHNLENWVCYIAYAAGFATGNFVGLKVEEKLAMGVRGFRIVTNNFNTPILSEMRNAGIGATSVPSEGSNGKVLLIFTIVPRNKINEIKDMICKHDPDAFYVIEDIISVKNANFSSDQKKDWGDSTMWY